MMTNPFNISDRLWGKIQRLRLLDNVLMQTALRNDAPAIQLILRIILDKPDLCVLRVNTQELLPNLASRDLILDTLAVDADGKQYNIEVQRSDSGAKPRRARYHSALMDVQCLEKGMDTEDLPESYVVFVTENDVLEAGLPVYHAERVVQETGKPFRDDAHIVYANASYVGEDAFGRLMADFRTDDPERMHFSLLADRVRRAKSNQKGVVEMSQVMQELIQEGYDEGYDEGHDVGYDEGYDEGHGVGYDEGHGVGYDEGGISILEQIMRSHGWSLSQAMDFVGMTGEQQAHFQKKMHVPG